MATMITWAAAAGCCSGFRWSGCSAANPAASRWPVPWRLAGRGSNGGGTAFISACSPPIPATPRRGTKPPACCRSPVATNRCCSPGTSGRRAKPGWYSATAEPCAAAWWWPPTMAAAVLPLPLSWPPPAPDTCFSPPAPTTAGVFLRRKWWRAGAAQGRGRWTRRWKGPCGCDSLRMRCCWNRVTPGIAAVTGRRKSSGRFPWLAV